MLHVKTSGEGLNRYVRNPKAELYLRFSTRDDFKDDLSSLVMKEIDGAYIVDGDCIRTPFGSTVFTNLSTGCQSLLVALKENDGNTWTSFLGAGDNVIELALKICRDYNLDLYVVLNRAPFVMSFDTYTFEINSIVYKDVSFLQTMSKVLYEEEGDDEDD